MVKQWQLVHLLQYKGLYIYIYINPLHFSTVFKQKLRITWTNYLDISPSLYAQVTLIVIFPPLHFIYSADGIRVRVTGGISNRRHFLSLCKRMNCWTRVICEWVSQWKGLYVHATQKGYGRESTENRRNKE